MIGRLVGVLETAVETFVNAVVDHIIAAWVEADE